MKILDMFCGAGGCSAGYAKAGFSVTGVDLYKQPRYPFEFYQEDAIKFLLANYTKYDIVHASPPCQFYSKTKVLTKKNHVDLVLKTREALLSCGVPYIIENVVGAELIKPTLLCGTMFNLSLYRHRIFETSFPVTAPVHNVHIVPQVKMGRKPGPHEYIQVVGNFIGIDIAKEAMGISWMIGKELSQAIPPAYTEYIANQFIEYKTLQNKL